MKKMILHAVCNETDESFIFESILNKTNYTDMELDNMFEILIFKKINFRYRVDSGMIKLYTGVDDYKLKESFPIEDLTSEQIREYAHDWFYSAFDCYFEIV